MAQCPGGLAQWMLPPATSTPCTPQMALPLHQPPPGWPATSAPCAPQMAPPLCQPPPGWLAMPYQQVVQLPKKPVGRGVTADAPTDKTTPMGGTCAQDHGRSSTRGRGGGSQSVRHPRGVQEKVSVQLPHQQGNLPFGSTPCVPPPPAPKGSLSGEVGEGLPSTILCGWLLS